jgi:type II secretory pathway pseudopilin PulG
MLKNALSMTNKADYSKARGDTIVEVLIAIAIASFAIGTSYALANKSLQNAIGASDRNQAVNIAENQIADLKIRHNTYDTTTNEDSFNADFGVPSSVSGGPYPKHGRDFCLIDGISVQSDPNWGPKGNPGITDDNSTFSPGNYDTNYCLQKGQFYVNISAQITSSSSTVSSNNTVYRISVTWPTIGEDNNSQAVLYYRF